VDLEILAALQRPAMFQRLVDSLPPSPTRVSLRLWGVLYGVYTLSDKTQSEVRHELALFIHERPARVARRCQRGSPG
jgi:hypothetical protein